MAFVLKMDEERLNRIRKYYPTKHIVGNTYLVRHRSKRHFTTSWYLVIVNNDVK